MQWGIVTGERSKKEMGKNIGKKSLMGMMKDRWNQTRGTARRS